MNGLTLFGGVVGAALSVTFLCGGAVFFWCGLKSCDSVVDEDGSTGRSDASFPLFATIGSFYLGLAVLMGCWVPVYSWIVVGAALPVVVFLMIIGSFLETAERACAHLSEYHTDDYE